MRRYVHGNIHLRQSSKVYIESSVYLITNNKSLWDDLDWTRSINNIRSSFKHKSRLSILFFPDDWCIVID